MLQPIKRVSIYGRFKKSQKLYLLEEKIQDSSFYTESTLTLWLIRSAFLHMNEDDRDQLAIQLPLVRLVQAN